MRLLSAIDRDFIIRMIGLGAHLFVKVSQLGDGEGTFRSSSQDTTCYYQSNHSKVETIPLSA